MKILRQKLFDLPTGKEGGAIGALLGAGVTGLGDILVAGPVRAIKRYRSADPLEGIKKQEEHLKDLKNQEDSLNKYEAARKNRNTLFEEEKENIKYERDHILKQKDYHNNKIQTYKNNPKEYKKELAKEAYGDGLLKHMAVGAGMGYLAGYGGAKILKHHYNKN